MNSIERVQAAIDFRPKDRVPVLPQLFGYTASLSGFSLLQYVQSGQIAAKCQLKALERFGHDGLFALFDTCVEAEAAGCRLSYKENFYPAVQNHVLSASNNLSSLRVPDPYKEGRCPQILEMIAILKKEAGTNNLVAGCVLGPMTLVGQLMGLEQALYTAVDFPERFAQILAYATEIIIAFGSAQIHSGADLLVLFEPSSSPEVVPAGFFREFILEEIQKIGQTLKKAGCKNMLMHITGNILPILKYYDQLQVDIANLDYPVDPFTARSKLQADLCLMGNIKPLSFIEQSPEQIYAKAKDLIKSVKDQEGFILSSGCEIPVGSKAENIAALVQAAKG